MRCRFCGAEIEADEEQTAWQNMREHLVLEHYDEVKKLEEATGREIEFWGDEEYD